MSNSPRDRYDSSVRYKGTLGFQSINEIGADGVGETFSHCWTHPDLGWEDMPAGRKALD